MRQKKSAERGAACNGWLRQPQTGMPIAQAYGTAQPGTRSVIQLQQFQSFLRQPRLTTTEPSS